MAALAVARTHWAIPASFAAAVLMSAFVVIAGFAIGFAYVPTALVMLVGAVALAIASSWDWWRRRTGTTAPAPPRRGARATAASCERR